MKLAIRCIMVITLLLLAAQSTMVAAAGTQKLAVTRGGGKTIAVNGEQMLFQHEEFPILYQGTTYLPVRKIAEALGKQVTLNSAKSTLSLSGSEMYESDFGGSFKDFAYNDRIDARLVTLKVEYDGKLQSKTINAIITGGKTFVPMRALADMAGATLEVTSDTINISKPIIIPHVQTQIVEKAANTSRVIGLYDDFLDSYADLAPSIVSYVNPDGTVNVGWVDTKSSSIKIAAMDQQLKRTNVLTFKMEMPNFGTFTKDDQGNYYILWGRWVEEDQQDKPSVQISKYSSTGAKLGDVLFTSGTQYFRGTKEPFHYANAKLQYSNGLLVAYFGRVMFQSEDGLNHQSSTALYVDTDNMKQVARAIPYSSHSFDQDVAFDGDTIVFAERGDYYDRGFTISKVTQGSDYAQNVTPFWFKFGAAIYQQTFSELGGIGVADDGYVLVGTSERTMSAEMAQTNHNESRNLFLQLVAKNFENVSEPVRSVGDNQRFTISLPGNANTVDNKGVVWLTSYTNLTKDNAAHPKLARIDGNRFVVMWENVGADNSKSSLDYKSTYYMIVSASGEVIKPATEIRGARINIGDSIHYANGAVYWAANTKGNDIILYKLDLQSE
ncbi:hypothetical protein PCCS19_54350 [Paenibacillus sp. CCS19]|uniref:stalk domain-containing protein n=1 Tax=Paenibacillus sp. CCS19 TaxID=3158387 RepID=UPI00255D6C9C|nr:stalk domain-containing protein [Paenibacillus cellulosilyticus]GMK42376.1 hypothetical protein PCCS19_54350 [Paenibacillus cellulosilyticus]